MKVLSFEYQAGKAIPESNGRITACGGDAAVTAR